MDQSLVQREFEEFVGEMTRRLRLALAPMRASDEIGDAIAEAGAYAWEHWSRVQAMANPHGYLYRVALSKSRHRLRPTLPAPDVIEVPDVEPKLIPAVMALAPKQRSAVWLRVACGWTTAEVAEALGISTSAVNTHIERGMKHLRAAIGDSHGN